MTELKHQRDVRAASNTFSREECAAVLDIIRTLRRGGDARVLVRSEGATRLERKFAGMLQRIDAHRESR
jgi:hypothetical protein